MPQDLPTAEINEIREHATWFIVMGIVLIVLGTIAVGSAVAMTLISMVLLGWLLIVAGIFDVIHGFARRRWSGFFVNLLGGILYAVAGLAILGNPGLAAVTITLLIAIMLVIAGVFRLAIAFSTRLQHRGWLIFGALVSILLGISIWDSWPLSGLWVIGLFVGINLIFDGWTEIALALAVRRIAAPAAQPA